MAQFSHQIVPLGEQLFFWRKHARWSRRQLSEAAGIATSTIQDLEHGHGTLTYYLLAIASLRLRLHAPGLGHRRLGTALRYERQLQYVSRRELARHLKISRTTIAALEANRSVRLSVIDAYVRTLRIVIVVDPR